MELGLWVVGIALIATYYLATIDLENQRNQGVEQFTQALAAAAVSHSLEGLPLPGQTATVRNEPRVGPVPGPLTDSDLDSQPVAVLRIASLGVEVPVYSDANELNLSRGAGWIGGTSAPNTGGNMAIAAHRDQYFRPLKDIRVGDTVELESFSGRDEFRVTRIAIVEPEDVSVLDDTAVSTITLVTCYPFYFIGHAPRRYVVQATAVEKSGRTFTSDAFPTAR